MISLLEYKQLIKDALEAHLNQSSSFTSEPYQTEQGCFGMPRDYQITPVVEPNTPQTEPLTEEWKEYLKRKSWNAWLSQKGKNEKIIKECKEVLEKLDKELGEFQQLKTEVQSLQTTLATRSSELSSERIKFQKLQTELNNQLQAQQTNFNRLQAEFNQQRLTEKDLKNRHLEELRVREQSCKKSKEELNNKIRELGEQVKELKVEAELRLGLEDEVSAKQDKVEELEKKLTQVKEKLGGWVKMIGEKGKTTPKKGWFW